MTGAKVNDGKGLEEVLDAIMVKREIPPYRRSQHLCADPWYRSGVKLVIIEAQGYIPHAVDRREEADIKQRDPQKKARRWVVDVCHSRFNRFRKLRVRYEKVRTQLRRPELACGRPYCFRKVPLKANMIDA